MVTTYLEFSEGDAGAHKFYEVSIEDIRVTIRFGRIGTVGRTETHLFSESSESERFYNRKIQEKRSKGYQVATPGQTQKKPVVERQMTEMAFWELIDATKESSGDVHEQVERLRRRLSRLSSAEILSFQTILDARMGESYQVRLWGAVYVINGGCSDDCFDYFRCWLVAQGQEIFERALADPDSLAELASIAEGEVECEEFGYVAMEAYETKTGKTDFWEKAPRTPRQLQGDLAEWDEEDETKLRILFPRLCARFWSG